MNYNEPTHWPIVTLAIIAVIALLAWLSVMLWPAQAREGGDWSQVDPEVREWIKTLTVPNSDMSCCGEAEAYEADLGEQDANGNNYAIVTGTRGNSLPVGTKLLIRPDRVQNRQGNPSGHVIVFANTSGFVYCFIPNGGL